MEPVDVVRKAVEVVETAKVPDDLRTLAFAKVLDMLSSTASIQPSSDRSRASSDRPREGAAGGNDQAGSDLISAVAEKMGIPSMLADRIFDDHEGELIFSGDVSALGDSRAEKVHNLAVLLLAGRRWAGLDGGSTTNDEVLRAEVDRLGLLDTNYSRHIASLKPCAIISGSGKKATYKIKYDGLEKAKKLGRALAGAE